MRGKVVIINRSSGLFAVQLEDGDFAVLEMLGGHTVEANDVVQGNLDELGGEEVLNVTQQMRMSVYGQSGRCTLEAARSLVSRQ